MVDRAGCCEQWRKPCRYHEGWLDAEAAAADEPVLTVDLRRQFGAVCIGWSRVPADAVAGCVYAGDTVDVVAEDCGVTREQVLVACWWFSMHGGGRRWVGWRNDAAKVLGGWKEGPCPDPPGRKEQ